MVASFESSDGNRRAAQEEVQQRLGLMANRMWARAGNVEPPRQPGCSGRPYVGDGAEFILDESVAWTTEGNVEAVDE